MLGRPGILGAILLSKLKGIFVVSPFHTFKRREGQLWLAVALEITGVGRRPKLSMRNADARTASQPCRSRQSRNLIPSALSHPLAVDSSLRRASRLQTSCDVMSIDGRVGRMLTLSAIVDKGLATQMSNGTKLFTKSITHDAQARGETEP